MRKFARVIVVDENQKVLVVRQRTEDGRVYCFPGGKVEVGERPQCAASREVFEELGIRKSPKELKPIYRGEFTFGEETWIGYYYITVSTGLSPNLLEFPKVDLAEFFHPTELNGLAADQASLSGVLTTVASKISKTWNEGFVSGENHGFI